MNLLLNWLKIGSDTDEMDMMSDDADNDPVLLSISPDIIVDSKQMKYRNSPQ
jgi:hypothetical protein